MEITEDQRQTVHANFWQLDENEKKDFYDCNLKAVVPAIIKASESRKSKIIQYSLPIDGIQRRVCGKFFCHTIDISEKRVRNFFKKTGKEIEENPNKKGEILTILIIIN